MATAVSSQALVNPYSNPYFATMNRSTVGATAEFPFQGQNLHSKTSSSGCEFDLSMQADGKLVLYGSQAWWASNTVGTGAYAKLQNDGNFVVYAWNGSARWNSRTADNQNERVLKQGDGNSVLYRSSGSVAWASGTNGRAALPSSGYCVTFSEITVMEQSADRPGGDYRSNPPLA